MKAGLLNLGSRCLHLRSISKCEYNNMLLAYRLYLGNSCRELFETLWCVTILLQQVSHSLRKLNYKQLLYIISITSKTIKYATG